MSSAKARTAAVLFVLGLAWVPSVQAGATEEVARAESPAWMAGQTRTVHAAGLGSPWVSALDGRELPVSYHDAPSAFQRLVRSRQLVPVGLARGDLDRDGLDDLIVAYAGSGSGWLALHRANLDARRSKLDGALTAPPFLTEVTVVAVPVVPDFVGAGDFDADGRTDLVVAERRRAELWWLRGTDSGVPDTPQRVPLAGEVTALAVGEVHRRDGLDDLVVGLRGPEGAELVVFRHREGAFRHPPQVIPLPGRIDLLALGPFDGGDPIDLAVAGDTRLTILSGSDSGAFLADAPRRFTLPDTIRGLVVGDVATQAGRDDTLAVLLDDDRIRLLPRTRRDDTSAFVSVEPPAWGTGNSDDIVVADFSNQPGQDLILRDTAAEQLLVRIGGLPDPAWVKLETETRPLAVLPMQLNGDSFTDLVLLIEGSTVPSVVLTAAAHTFFVDVVGDDPDVAPGDGIAATASGDCTLRAAIDEANASAGTDRIAFDIPGAGPHTIQPLTPLPAILETLVLDGTTEPDYAGTPIVELDGSLAGGADGIALMAPSCTVRGLAVNRFEQSGIAVVWPEATDNRIQGNYIGTDLTGTVAAPNIGNGIAVINGAPLNFIGTDGDGVFDAGEGNLISGNLEHGVLIHGEETNGNVIAGNLIGTDVTGASALGNAIDGVIVVHGWSNVIGTDGDGVADDAEGNVVSANGADGILLLAQGAEQNIVAGNRIGTNADGTAALGNGGSGIGVVDHANLNRIGTNGDGLSDVEERNLVSGNLYRGVLLAAEVEENVVAGNFIGTDVTGTLAVPNVSGGVELSNGARRNLVGTDVDGQSDPAERNVISGNNGVGITLFGEPSIDHNVIAGNFIGTQVDGVTPLGNLDHGITIHADANNNTIGGVGVTPRSCDGPCNVIAYNGGGGSDDGLRLVAGTGNAVIGNVIHSNVSGAAIDIDVAGTSGNDLGDIDGGANNTQNFPLLTDATTDGGATTIEGALDSIPDTIFRLEFYANAACDFSGYGEGEMLLGTRNVLTGATGQAVFSFGVSPPVPDGQWLSATATRLEPDGTPSDTSEFSPCLGIGPPTSAGRVPDGDEIPGAQLTAERGSGRYVNLSWSASCLPGDEDYAVYLGTIGEFGDHFPRFCTTGGATERGVWTPGDAVYFLVVPLSPNREGSHGTDSHGVERQPGVYHCRPQSIGECPTAD